MKKLVLIFATALLISCGNDKKEEGSEMKLETPPVEEAAPAPVTEADPAATTDDSVAIVNIEATDQMKFNKAEIHVKAGQKVKLTLTHVGTMGVKVMGHNWVLLKEGTDMAAVGNAAAQTSDIEHIPAEFKNQIIAHTKMLGGG